MLTTQQLINLRLAASEAVDCEETTGIPSEYILSQWALESGYGAHSPNNNCFGIKDYPGSQGRQLLHTTEWFSPGEANNWVASVPGRSAEQDTQHFIDANNRVKYNCQDWFASFDTLHDCFIKRASRFHGPIADQYKKDHDLLGMVQASARIYSTDPNYVNTIMQIASRPEVVAAISEAKTKGPAL